MNRFPRYCLLLCCSLVCLNGFLPVVSKAYNDSYNFYPITSNDSRLDIITSEGRAYDESMELVNNKYCADNADISNVSYMVWYQHDNTLADNEQAWTFPYNPDIYDYYMLGTVTGETDGNNDKFTFKPRAIKVAYYNTEYDRDLYYPTSNVHIFDVDSHVCLGYSFSMKIDFEIANNQGIKFVYMSDDKDGYGNVPDNLVVELGIMAIDKTASETVALQQILEQLNDMETSINNTIVNSANGIKDTIENQYNVPVEENFGVTDIVDQVNEKAGVLSFGTDTLVNFLDLFDAANATNTKLTFPGFSMKVQGVDYQVWPDYHYDLSELENQFGALIEVVRWSCVMCVWLGVLNYLVKAYDTIFGR